MSLPLSAAADLFSPRAFSWTGSAALHALLISLILQLPHSAGSGLRDGPSFLSAGFDYSLAPEPVPNPPPFGFPSPPPPAPLQPDAPEQLLPSYIPPAPAPVQTLSNLDFPGSFPGPAATRARSAGHFLHTGRAVIGTDGSGPAGQGTYLPPSYLDAPPPPYPAAARLARREGVVIVDALIDASGRVLSADIRQGSGDSSLDRAALAAVRSWRFHPALRAGLPAPARVQLPIRFRLHAALDSSADRP